MLFVPFWVYLFFMPYCQVLKLTWWVNSIWNTKNGIFVLLELFFLLNHSLKIFQIYFLHHLNHKTIIQSYIDHYHIYILSCFACRGTYMYIGWPIVVSTPIPIDGVLFSTITTSEVNCLLLQKYIQQPIMAPQQIKEPSTITK